MLGIAGIAIATTILAVPLPPLMPITFMWNASPDADGYELRASPDLSIPATNWPSIAYVPGGSTTSFVYQAAPTRKMFYVNVASNFWGYGDPSNITNTPAPITNNVGGFNLKR